MKRIDNLTAPMRSALKSTQGGKFTAIGHSRALDALKRRGLIDRPGYLTFGGLLYLGLVKATYVIDVEMAHAMASHTRPSYHSVI